MINIKGELYDLTHPLVMAIVNASPDSFYGGSRVESESEIENRIQELVNQKADIIDVGAYSSKPGAKDIAIKDEIKRLDSVLSVLKKRNCKLPVSVDTFRSEVAKWAIDNYHVDIINDISGGKLDDNMLSVVGKSGVAYIAMHMQGNPQNMQDNPQYDNIIKDILYYFSEIIQKAKLEGIVDIIVDPGFGFGKTIEHNYQLMARLNDLQILEKPILIGVSRKSMIYKLLNTSPEESLNGSTVLHTISLLNNANIIRTHDVKQAKEAIKIVEKIKSLSND